MLCSLKLLKQSLGITCDEQDDWLTFLIKAASKSVENYVGRPLLFGKFVEKGRGFQGRVPLITLPVTPLMHILTVNYQGTEFPEPEQGWEFEQETGLFYPAQAHLSHEIPWEVLYAGGYLPEPQEGVNAPLLPDDIKAATLLTAVTSYHKSSRDPLLRSETEQGIGSSSWTVPDGTSGILTAEAAGLLKRYRGPGIC